MKIGRLYSVWRKHKMPTTSKSTNLMNDLCKQMWLEEYMGNMLLPQNYSAMKIFYCYMYLYVFV